MSRLVPFFKMHGAGNDFIMMDHRDLNGLVPGSDSIAALCDRRTGVGADGLIIIGPGSSPGSSFRMIYYNADGGEAEMCGNGARCSVSFAHHLGLVRNSCTFDTQAGLLDGTRHGPEDIEVRLTPWRDLELEIDVGKTLWPAHHSCDTGVPHLVIPVDDIESVPVTEWGSRLRHHGKFSPAGTNVNWVTRVENSERFQMRTYERGVEAETLACGTGASAVAVVLCRLGLADSPVTLQTRGGDLLIVSIDMENDELRLRGPAVTSYHGEVLIDE
ncbi:MAG: diaminopimelate epimerase [Candidatus Krumholzibacteria bacterium]|nr:diaminopimelate epimerase [Candidatus Krumholzibacteria bacterium]